MTEMETLKGYYDDGYRHGRLDEKEAIIKEIDEFKTHHINKIIFDEGFTSPCNCFTFGKEKIKYNCSEIDILNIHIGFNLALQNLKQKLIGEEKNEINK